MRPTEMHCRIGNILLSYRYNKYRVFLRITCIMVSYKNFPTNQESWPSVGTIASTLAQYSAIYGNTLGQFSWLVGLYLSYLSPINSDIRNGGISTGITLNCCFSTTAS